MRLYVCVSVMNICMRNCQCHRHCRLFKRIRSSKWICVQIIRMVSIRGKITFFAFIYEAKKASLAKNIARQKLINYKSTIITRCGDDVVVVVAQYQKL